MTSSSWPAASFTDIAAMLREPFAHEDIAGLETPLVVVALPDSFSGVTDDELVDLRELLTSVRAVTVGVLTEPVETRAIEFVDSFDILLGDGSVGGFSVVPSADVRASVAAIAAGATANPQASVALVQLLRMRAYANVQNGLALESTTYSMLQSGPEFALWLSERGDAVVPPDPDPPVLFERRGTAAIVTLNRPHRANAISADLRDALVEHLRVAHHDPTISGVVLCGAGGSFSSGGDLAEFGTFATPADAHATRLARSPAWWIYRMARDLRAEIHGACIGAGIELPCFAGTVIGAPDTTVRLPEVAMGLIPGAGGTVSLPARIGPQRTAYLAITGAELNAEQALGWGVIDRLVEP